MILSSLRRLLLAAPLKTGIGLAVGFITVQLISLAPIAGATSLSVQPLSPVSNATVQGSVTLTSTVKGLAPDTYEMFWAVGRGQWNRMSQEATNANVATATISVSNWNWQADNNYQLRFIALLKSNWQPIESDITIHVGSETTPKQAAAAVTTPHAAITAPTVTSIISLNKLSVTTNPVTTPSLSTTKKLFVDAQNSTTQQATAWGAAHTDASSMSYLAAQPLSRWFGNWNSDVEADANDYVSRAAAAGSIPTLVTYNIPQRDCGSYSAGGADSGGSYINWINAFADGIGQRNAIVIVEPDALANMSCLSPADTDRRLSLLQQAVSILKTKTDATVYLDAGHPGWHSAAAIADLLKSAGIASADGFSLNVSNFDTTAANIDYGAQISALTNNAHFVVDTSRNGNGATANNQWCNPLGRAVGVAPTLDTGTPLVDAYLWVKDPGASDGNCGTVIDSTYAPTAGTWWPQYANQLLENAGH